MTQKAINYAEVLCELNIDAAELSDMEAVVRENPELQSSYEIYSYCGRPSGRRS